MPLSMPCLPASQCNTCKDACWHGFTKLSQREARKDQVALLEPADAAVSNIDKDTACNTETNVELDEPETEMNGIPALPEVVTIQVQESNIAAFSLPQECISYVPEPGAVICRFENGDCERMITCNTELSKDELSMLQAFQEEVVRQKKAFSPSLINAAVRYLNDTGSVEDALQSMEQTQAWRLSYFKQPIPDTELLDDLKRGLIYFCGRDKALRPALVLRASRVPIGMPSEQFGRLFVFCMEYFLRYMMVPGRVENVVVLVDLKDVSYSQIPGVAALMELKEVLSKQDAGRVFCFYVCNMPFIVRAITSVVQAAMTEAQRQKMRFVSDARPFHYLFPNFFPLWLDWLGAQNSVMSKDVSQLKEDFALNQLEEDLGGTRPLDTKFFPFPLPPGALCNLLWSHSA